MLAPLSRCTPDLPPNATSQKFLRQFNREWAHLKRGKILAGVGRSAGIGRLLKER